LANHHSAYKDHLVICLLIGQKKIGLLQGYIRSLANENRGVPVSSLVLIYSFNPEIFNSLELAECDASLIREKARRIRESDNREMILP